MKPVKIRALDVSLLARVRKIPAYMLDRHVSLFKKVGVILGLLYVISPVDIVPDVIPVIGWLDDLGVLTIMYSFMMNELRDYIYESHLRIDMHLDK